QYASGLGGNDIVRNVERVIGTDFADTLIGADGVNTLDGGSGNDTLFGGDGDDVIITGDGEDMSVVTPGGGSETVTDFDVNEDAIDLSSYGIEDYSDLADRMFDDASGNAVISLGPGESITLEGVSVDDLGPDNFFGYVTIEGTEF